MRPCRTSTDPERSSPQAGPCAFRSRAQGYLTTIGVMEFDSADLDRIGTNGTLQDVITHEMLHVLGIGTLWYAQGLTMNPGTPTVTYIGAAGKKGCADDGGVSSLLGGSSCREQWSARNRGLALARVGISVGAHDRLRE